MPPLLSIIIPAYNEEQRLPETLNKVLFFLSQQEFDAEVLVVDNGSIDRTASIVTDSMQDNPNVKLLREEVAGKGLAVRKGMLEATGRYRFICDADLAMPIEEVLRFLPPAQANYDIAIGSREAPGAVRHDEPEYRHLIGRVFNYLVRILAVPGFMDTQCGFKSFRGDVANELFRIQKLDGWTFDVEVLFIALKRGYRIIEVPINWYYFPGSRIRVFRDSINMFIDLFKIRLNWLRNLYVAQNRET
ncbi:MAG: glycosyltransferase family 2 protein [Anaerolineales bacterium]|nr:glycosyltransferase family 2 protein [Anaerolineales bacterium]